MSAFDEYYEKYAARFGDYILTVPVDTKSLQQSGEAFRYVMALLHRPGRRVDAVEVHVSPGGIVLVGENLFRHPARVARRTLVWFLDHQSPEALCKWFLDEVWFEERAQQQVRELTQARVRAYLETQEDVRVRALLQECSKEEPDLDLCGEISAELFSELAPQRLRVPHTRLFRLMNEVRGLVEVYRQLAEESLTEPEFMDRLYRIDPDQHPIRDYHPADAALLVALQDRFRELWETYTSLSDEPRQPLREVASK